MKIVRNETRRDLLTVSGVTLSIDFEPVERASPYWRERGRTHSQRFRFVHDGREYWGEVIRTFDRAATSGERVAVEVELCTMAGTRGRALAENQRVTWRAAIKRQFARDLAAFVEAQGRDPEPVPAGPEGAPATAEAATVTIETNWAAASGIIETALIHGTGEGRRMAREELGRMAALADERNALAVRIAEAARRAREARGGLSGGAREVVQSILAALDPVEPDPLALFDFDGEAMRVAARPVEYVEPAATVARVAVTDSDSDGSPCYRVAAEAENGEPLHEIKFEPDYAGAKFYALSLAVKYGVDVYDSTVAGRDELARTRGRS